MMMTTMMLNGEVTISSDAHFCLSLGGRQHLKAIHFHQQLADDPLTHPWASRSSCITHPRQAVNLIKEDDRRLGSSGPAP